MRHLRLVGRAGSVRIDLATSEDPVVREETRTELIDALGRLSVDDRTIIALRWFEEMSEADMAEVLDVRPGTVKSRLHRAMARLRAELGGGTHE
ncbi:MAG: hypothetical protein DHS20C19_15430 [Acidimicrobiales bacterium]|nr:MAG: hypothetical protein DHS20C19_15430 [Acidimicrobiales bacterium]